MLFSLISWYPHQLWVGYTHFASYRVFKNIGQIEYGYKTLKFMVFDHEEDISVVYTSERFM